MPAPITTEAAVTEVAEAIRAAGSFAMDLEFVPEGYYVPELALVQVGWGAVDAPEVVAIDPLAVDARPVLQLVGEETIETLVHAGQADFALLSATFGIVGRNVWDTQVGAAFTGLGDQVGYAPLVERVHGVRLNKGSQFTEWLARPLTEGQLEYALDDVRYLPALWSDLRERLESSGRLRWVAEECASLAHGADKRPDPAEAYRRVKGWRRLNRPATGALRALAAWREHEARSANRPPSRVLNDRSLLELARSGPRDVADVEGVRGVSGGTARRHGAALLRAVEQGSGDPPAPDPRGAAPEPLAGVWTTVLQAIVQGHALELGIAARFLATRTDLEVLAAWAVAAEAEQPPVIPVLDGWRRELVGGALLRWLDHGTPLRADRSAATGLSLEAPRA